MLRPTNRRLITGSLLLGLAVALAGCESGAGTGAIIGGATGAGIGGIVGANSHARAGEGALIGGAIGALSGAVIGDSMDRRAREDYHRYESRGYSEPAPPPPPVYRAVRVYREDAYCPPPPVVVVRRYDYRRHDDCGPRYGDRVVVGGGYRY
jgi:hypothetical protein